MASNTKMRKKKCPSGKTWAKLPIPKDAPTGTKAKYGCKFIDGDKGGASMKNPGKKKAKKKNKKFDPVASMYSPNRKMEKNKKGKIIGSKSFKGEGLTEASQDKKK
tara:strand:+ start:816 stop:1133 length:318 start_codon:yes stop_codon:yes gene_type:complete